MAGISIAITEKRFANLVFSDFALTVEPGEVVAVLGPSGVGKSTLLRMVAGIDRDFIGRIEVGGQNAHLAPAPGFVFQDARLLPWLDAKDNVELGGGEADRWLTQVGLEGLGASFPNQLSGGMQRRVALARALAARSGLLLLDEPFVSLDEALSLEMQDLLEKAISLARPTVLLVTHSEAEAKRLADRVVVLEGRPARIVDDRPIRPK